jgi:3-isopropylmalate dehydrogenase
VSRRIVFLPGDGIGPEVAAEAVRVLERLPVDVQVEEHDFGGVAIDRHGDPLPAGTLAACAGADAVLMGAVGGPQYDRGEVRPEEGLIRLRPARLGDVDLLIVRELVGGLYYGARGTRPDGTVYDTLEYHPDAVRRIVRRAFELARGRRRHLTSVDKANVLLTSRMWRGVVDEVAPDYEDVERVDALVDSVAMRLVTEPQAFDVLVMENTFGDILSDVAAGATGGLGLAASASLGDGAPGLFEPVHGSAPELAGRGVANPAAMLRSVALMLRHALDEPGLAEALDAAVDAALAAAPTPDLGGGASTRELADAALDALVVPEASWT